MKYQQKAMVATCVIGLSISALCANAFAQNTGQATVARSSELKAQPFSDAATLKVLTENQKIDVVSRKASWMEVRDQSLTGWVKMLSLRFENKPVETSNKVSDTAKSLLSFVKTGSSGSTTTTGAKGWSKESFANLTPNMDGFEKMKLLASEKSDAVNFAKQENLKEQEQAYLKTKGEQP